MSLTIILIGGVILSIAFHFAGIWADAKKTVWLVIVLVWAGVISIATSEVKPKAYEDLKKMQGKYTDTDRLIEKSMPEISVYEMVLIKSSFLKNEPKE